MLQTHALRPNAKKIALYKAKHCVAPCLRSVFICVFLKCAGPLGDTKKFNSSSIPHFQDRWLCAQSGCTTCNCKVWSDDTVKDVVQGSFLFWCWPKMERVLGSGTIMFCMLAKECEIGTEAEGRQVCRRWPVLPLSPMWVQALGQWKIMHLLRWPNVFFWAHIISRCDPTKTSDLSFFPGSPEVSCFM